MLFNILTGNITRYIIIGLIIFVLAFASYKIYNFTVAANNAKLLEEVVEEQKRIIDSIQEDLQKMQSAQRDLTNIIRRQNTELISLKTELNDILSINKENPEVIENKINEKIKNMNRCIEILTGSALTEQEKKANKNDYNKECPEIHNNSIIKSKS